MMNPELMSDLELADALFASLKREADRRNSAYDRFGMDNTPKSVDPLVYEAVARLKRSKA